MREYRAYIDESGDRGTSVNSSPFFILAAVVFPDESEPILRGTRDQLCIDLKKPTQTTLHWSENLKDHSSRKYACNVLGTSDVVISYVIIDKAACSNDPGGLGNHTKMYNYALRRMLERLSWLAQRNDRDIRITLAHVKNFKYQELNGYLATLRSIDTEIKWQRIASIKHDHPATRHLLQFADIAAGALRLSISPDQFGAVEYAYLAELEPRLYRHSVGKIKTYGLNVVGANSVVFDSQPWWHSFPK